MTMSEHERMLALSAELVIRPSTSGWPSAGGVPDSEPRIAHSSGEHTTSHLPSDASSTDFLRIHDLERALLALDRRTAGRAKTRAERRLAEHYRRQLGDQPIGTTNEQNRTPPAASH